MTTPDTAGLHELFTLWPGAWSPRKAVFRVVHAHLAQRGETITPQELYTLLRARGFTESRRHGKGCGFNGIQVPDELAAAPRLVPEHSAASYRRGDRSPEAIAARQREAAQKARPDEHLTVPLTTADGGIVDKLSSPAAVIAAFDRQFRLDFENRNGAERSRLRREAADIERLIEREGRGHELPESHRLVIQLRALRRQMDDLA